MRVRPATASRALLGAFAVVAGVLACSGIITGPDAGPATGPRSMRVTPPRLELSLTDTARMSANLYDVTGAAAVLDPAIRLRFVAADTLIARVDSAGLVTAIANGTTTVTASYGALSLGITVVVLGRPRIVIVSGNAQTAEQGDTLPLPLVVRALDAAGLPFANRSLTFRIASGGGALSTVQSLTDVNGLASARWVLGLPLSTQSVAAASAGSDSALFTATATPGTRPARVAITAPLATLAAPGATTTMTAAVFNVANVPLPSAAVTWMSTSPSIATVTGVGLVTAVAAGTTYVRAASGVAADSVLVTVNMPPVMVVTPTLLAYSWTIGSASPAAQTAAVTNSGGGSLGGLTASTTYGVGATGWLSIALNATVAPATLTVTLVPGSTSAGTYAATVRVASAVAGVAARDVAVTLTVSPPAELPKLQLGADFTHPAGLQAARGLTLPSALPVGQSFTLRSLVPEAIGLSLDSVTDGQSTIIVTALAGATSVPYWVQGIEGSSGAMVSVVAEAAGYAPDTIDVTMVRPAARLALVGPGTVPASGGDDPVLQVTVGRNDSGTLVPMAVRAFGVAPTFDVFATTSIGLVRFRATAATVGADQGPSICVAFDLRPGRSATTLPDPAFSVPASLSVVRSGVAGTAGFVLASLVAEYDVIGGNPSLSLTSVGAPVINVAPAAIAFFDVAASATRQPRQVAITNAGGGTLSGLSASVAYGADAFGWLTIAIDSTTAPATMTVVGFADFLESGTYTATITISSTVAGVAPRDLPVTFTITTGPRLVITSGDGQQVGWGQFAPDSLKVRALDAGNNPVGGAFVRFTVSANGGSVLPDGALTDANGYVATRWEIGVARGTHAVTVTRPGFVSAVFTGTSVAGAFVTRVDFVAGRRTLSGAGDTLQLAVNTYNVADSLITTALVTWQSADPSIATIDATGLVTAVGPGQALISAFSDDGGADVLLAVRTPLQKLDLGPDISQPAGLQAERAITIPTAPVDPFTYTLRSLDAAGLLIATQANLVGSALATVQWEGGSRTEPYWTQGIEGTAGRTVTVIAEAAGYLPDTMVVTLTRPGFRLGAYGPTSVPASGGADPVVVLTVGENVSPGNFAPMSVRIGGTPPSFTLGSGSPARALLRLVAGSSVVGVDQGPSTAVTFAIAPGSNSTSNGQFLLSPANLLIVRTGVAGTVDVSATGPTGYDAVVSAVQYTLTGGAAPVISVAPDSLTFTSISGSAAQLSQQVAITNAGGGSLSGLAADVLYGIGASDWLSIEFDSVTAPTTMTVVAFPSFAAVGTYTATISLSSTVPGVAPRVIPVTYIVRPGRRIEIVSGDGQQVVRNEFAPDSLKVRVLDENDSPVGDSLVSFTVSTNGGSVSPASATTSNNGVVATRWLMSDLLGTHTVTVSRSGFQSAVFTGTSIAGAAGPSIGVAPAGLTINAVSGATSPAALPVAITNTGGAALTGLTADVLFGAGASDWINVSLDLTTAPATLTVTPSTTLTPVGTFTATISIASAVAGVVPVNIPVTLTVRTVMASQLAKVSGDGQSGLVATTLPAPMVARVTDSTGTPVPGAAVRWRVTWGSVERVLADSVTDADGFVRYSLALPTIALPVTVEAIAVGLSGSPQLFTATTIAGPATAVIVRFSTVSGILGQPILPGFTAWARDQYDNIASGFTGPITMALSNGPAGAGLGGTVTRNAVAGVVDFADLTVDTPNSSWVLTASSPGLASGASAAFSIVPTFSLQLVNTPVVGVSGTATVRATLNYPAPSGGLAVTLTSGNSAIALVNAPTTVIVPQGGTTADFTVTGVAQGSVSLTVQASSYATSTSQITVSTNTISVPLTLNVPYTRTASLPINLTQPAPSGGTLITVISGNPAIVGVATPTVLIAAGTLSGNAQLQGIALGEVAVIATGPNLATGTSSVRVTATLDIVESNVTINAGFSTASLTTRLLSGGTVFAAPAGGVPLSFASRDPGCVAAPTNVSVAAGLNSVSTTADYGGTSPTPCSTYLVVSSPSFDVDSVRITVNPPPTTSVSLASTVAAGLSRDGILFLGAASPAGGTVVTLTSSDPTRLLVAPNSATVGTASIQLDIPPGAGYTYFTYAAIEGQTGTAVLSLTVDRYQSPTPATITLDPLGVEASGSTSFTMPGADGGGTVYVGSLGPAGPSQSVTGSTMVRAGGQPVVVTLTSTNPAAVVPVVGGLAASPATVTIAPGQSSASYGLRPIAAGTATITATAPTASTPGRTDYPATITVTQATSSFSVTSTVAAGLSRDGILFLGAASPAGGTVVTLTSSDPTRLVLAPNSTTVGIASIDITIPAGSSYQYFTYAAMEARGGTTATISGVVQGVPAAFSNPVPVVITLDPLGVEASGSTSFTMPGADGGGTVYVGSLGPAGPSQSVTGSTMVRAGGQPVVVTLTSTNPAAVVPVVGGLAASPATVTIAPGQSSASYGLRPIAAGTATITATAPTASTPGRTDYPATITVTQATSSFSVTSTVAAGLSRDGILFLGAASPAGGTVVTLTSSDPTRLVLAPNSTTVGIASIDITIPAGSSYQYFTYAAMEARGGTTATISGVVQGVPAAFSNPVPVVITIDSLGVELSGSTTVTTLGSDGSGTVYLGSLGPAGPSQSVTGSTMIRAGGPTIAVTLTSTTPTVAVPVVGGIAASPRTITLGPGQSSASFGIRPLVAGTTTITATSPSAVAPARPNYPATITVNSPSSSISISPAVGAGLAMQGIVFLQVPAPAGGTTVTLTSSDPSRLLVAPNMTSAGATQVDIALPQGATYTYFTVMGLEDVTGNPTVTAQTPGYTDATASVAVQPIGVQWSGTTTLTTLSADGGGTVSVGIISGVPGNRTVSPAQEIRFGGVPRTITMTSSNAAVALPVVAGVAQQGITVTLLPGAASASVGVRAVAAGSATIAPSGPGLVAADAPGNPPTVTVTVPYLTLSFSTRVQGAGLAQEGIIFLQTSVPAGGRTLTLISSDPTRLLLAPNATTTGASQVTFDLAAGSGYTYFTVMGLEGVTGAATVTASISGFRDSTYTFTVVQPAVTLNGPQPTRTVAQGDDYFQAQVGVPSGVGVLPQVVRIGAPAALTVTLVSSAPSIGTLVVGGTVGSPQTIEIAVGQSITTSSAGSRANFRPLSAGNATITATIPGYLQQGNAIRTVTVTP